MLKRSDLAKQLELVVQQEIKNYQDSLNFVLGSIRALTEELTSQREQSLENYALLHSEQSNLQSQLNTLIDETKEIRKTISSFMHDQIETNQSNSISIKDLYAFLYDTVEKTKSFSTQVKNVDYALAYLRDQQSIQTRVFNDNLDDLDRKFKNSIHKCKEEILDAPTEASIVKKELEEQLASHVVDVCGITREININRKSFNYLEKKIEHIYTLIGRSEYGGEK